MPVAHRHFLARVCEPLRRVLAHRLQQPVARLACRSSAMHQRLVHQPRRAGRARRSRSIPSPAQTASAASSVQPPAKTASRRSSARSGSVSRSWLQSSAARSVCWRGSAVPAAAGQQPEAVVQPRRDLLDRQRRDPRRRQLDRQRHAVQPRQICATAGRVLVGQRRSRGCAPARPLDEQPHRRRTATASLAGTVARSGSASDGTRQAVSPPHARAARGWWPARAAGAGPQQRARPASAQASSRCSQLSSTSSAGAGPAAGDGRRAAARPALPHAQRRRHGLRRPAPGRRAAPAPPARRRRDRLERPAASPRASRVLPQPPAPVSVSSRVVSSSSLQSGELGPPADEGGERLGRLWGGAAHCGRRRRAGAMIELLGLRGAFPPWPGLRSEPSLDGHSDTHILAWIAPRIEMLGPSRWWLATSSIRSSGTTGGRLGVRAKSTGWSRSARSHAHRRSNCVPASACQGRRPPAIPRCHPNGCQRRASVLNVLRLLSGACHVGANTGVCPRASP